METPPTETDQTRHSQLNRRVDRSLLISLIAVGLSVVGIFVSIYEARVMREQQDLLVAQKSASAWPYVDVVTDVSHYNDTIATFQLSIQNKGMGPATIGKVNYLYRNHRFDTVSLARLLKADVPEFNFGISQQFRVDSIVVPPGEMIKVMTLNVVGREPGVAFDFIGHLSRVVDLKFCYCSVYGDCWFKGNGKGRRKDPDCVPFTGY